MCIRDRSNSLTEGTNYVLVSNENYALTNLTNGASGESIRLEPLYVEKTENGICDAKIAEPSFISTFMGSLRYYNNSIEDGPTVEDSKVVQNLMMYVYKDRIELQMKNHGVKTVSYTHLDVYKRQIYILSLLLIKLFNFF